MAKFSAWLAEHGISWPSHLWAGTSITEQKTTNRIKHLLSVGDSHTIRFLSVEPQVKPLDLTPFLPQVDWVLHGGESGHHARSFHVEWAVELLAACKQHGVPYFLKQLGSVVMRKGKRLTFGNAHASDWSEWPQELTVREVPKC
jgi:protein gp37